MNDEHSPLRALKQKWEEEEAARDTQEEHAQQLFLEAEASLTFAPIEDFLTRLGKVLSAAGASVEIDTAWDHVSDRRLRRAARIMSSNPPGRLSLDFVIQGMSIFYRDTEYRFTGGIGKLIPAITADVEQFFASHRNQLNGKEAGDIRE
jgi:hypothetical protein